MSKVIPFKRKPVVIHKPLKRGDWSDLEEQRLTELRHQHKTAAEIAVLMNRTKSSIESKIVQMDHTGGKFHVPSQIKRATQIPPDLDTDSPYGQAKIVLRNRATRGLDGFLLDGRKVGFYDVIREANRVLKSAGMPQIKGSHEWDV